MPNDYSLTAVADRPDSRDNYFRPALMQLKPLLDPDIRRIEVLDQEKEGACTGVVLAAVINLLNRGRRIQRQELLGAEPLGTRMGSERFRTAAT